MQQSNEIRREATIKVAIKLGHLQVLDQELILESQHKNEGPNPPVVLEEVQTIDLRHSCIHALDEMAIMSCVCLRLCNLSSCYIENISPFYDCINLLKLDLSDNQISIVPSSNFWSSLRSLQILYLNGNLLSDKENIIHLNGCQNLRILTLYNTPLYLSKNYRHHVVNSIFSLKALDQHVISDEEVIENIHMSAIFQAMSAGFKLPLHVTIKPGTGVKDELCVCFRLLLAVNRIIAKYCPVAIIQRWIRGWVTRRKLIKADNKGLRDFVLKTRRNLQLQNQSSVIYIEPSSPHTITKATTSPRQFPSHQYEGPPPPPSSSQSSMLKRHILGLDAESRKIVHINLSKLQQNIEQAEDEDSGKKLTHHYKSQQDGKHLVTLTTSSKEYKKYITPRKSKGTIIRSRQAVRTQESSQAVRTQENREKTGRNDEKCLPLKDTGRAAKRLIPPCNEEVLGLSGTPLSVLAMPDLATIKKGNGDMIRQGEKEIEKHVLTLREPPPTKHATPTTTMSKDDFIFTRVYATMNLTVLNSINKVYIHNKRNKELSQKVDLVSKERQERVKREKKIEAFQKRLRDGVRDWRAEEEGKLKQKRGDIHGQREGRLLMKLKEWENAHTSMQRERQDHRFSQSFGTYTTLVSNMVSHKDRVHSREESNASYRERVRKAQQDCLEQQEEVRMYLQLRRNKFMEEGKQYKKLLDAKILEMASQKLLESRQKIAEEVARKETARDAIAALALKTSHDGRGKTITPLNREPLIHTEPTLVYTGFGMSSEFKSPSHISKMVRGSHDTWQRGAKVMSGKECLPILDETEKTPLMYEMMKPYQIPIQHVFSELKSSTSSIATS